jgi:retinol dehydrogenase 12
MGDFESVKASAKRAEDLDRIDTVCENAGVGSNQYRGKAGMEEMIAVTVVGTFLLVLDLLPVLKRLG